MSIVLRAFVGRVAMLGAVVTLGTFGVLIMIHFFVSFHGLFEIPGVLGTGLLGKRFRWVGVSLRIL